MHAENVENWKVFNIVIVLNDDIPNSVSNLKKGHNKIKNI